MPTTEQAQKAADRKARREASKVAAMKQADTDLRTRKADVNQAKATEAKETPAPEPQTQAQLRAAKESRKVAKRKAASEQAQKDAMLKPPSLPPVEGFKPPLGRKMTLHELNQRQRAVNVVHRDVARDAATAAARATMETLQGKQLNGGIEKTYLQMHKTQDEVAKRLAAQGPTDQQRTS